MTLLSPATAFAAATALLAAAWVLPAAAQPAPGDPAPTGRVASGDTPSEVAVAASAEDFPDGGAQWAVLARDDEFADALTGAGVAAGRGPVLFTRSTALPAATRTELERVLPQGRTVYLMGGEVAIAPEVAEALGDRWTVRRVSGANRILTALAAARLVDDRDRGGAAAEVWVAAGFRWPDAVTGGAAAVAAGAALVLVDSAAGPAGGSNADVIAYLAERDRDRIRVLGGAVAVPPSFDTPLAQRAGDYGRLAGSDRAGTAAAVAGSDAWTPTGYTIVLGYPASGETDDTTTAWGYALAASTRAATLRRPILLVHGDDRAAGTWDGVDVPTAMLLDDACELAADVVGSPGVVTDATVAEVERLRCAGAPALDVGVHASGLDLPWAVADLGDGRLLVTERDTGDLRLIVDGALRFAPVWTAPDLYAEGEAGLMGLVPAPDFATSGTLFVCASQQPGPRIRVLRLRMAGETASDGGVVADVGRAHSNHDGCALAVTREDHLLVTVGDAGMGESARDPAAGNGKVHRMTLGGEPVDGNVAGTVWTVGHRNPQGIDEHPVTSVVLAAEHGPDNNDEVNRLVDGGDYGWPDVSGPSGGAGGTVDPIWASGPATIATSGVAFAAEPQWSGLRGALVIATLKDQSLRALPLTPDGATAAGPMETLFDAELGHGRLRGVTPAADGGVWVTTSNGSGEDRILRVRPVPPTVPAP